MVDGSQTAGPRGGTLGQLLAELDASLFVGREAEVATFAAWLVATNAAPGLLHVWGPGGVGKSALLRAFRRRAIETGRPWLLVDGRDLPPTPEGLLDALGGGPLERVVAQLNATEPLLLFDTFEALGDLTHFLQHEFLPRLATSVKVVLAGRDMLGLAWDNWRQLVRPLELRTLAPEGARTYLRRRGIGDVRLVDQIQHATRGHPLALSLAADLVQQTGVRDLAQAPEWRRTVRWLIERLLQDIPEPVRVLLEASAVVRHFDEATLAAIAGHDDIGAAFDRVCGLSIVRSAEHGLRLHDDVRQILLEDLRWRHPERFRELRLRALEYYANRVRSAMPVEREWLLAERLALWENAFVQTLLFTEEPEGRVFLDWGRAEDRVAVIGIWTHWLDNWLSARMKLDYDRVADRRLLERVLDLPSTWLRVARDRDGRATGFGTAIPITEASQRVMLDHPGLAPVITASRARFPVPAQVDNSNEYIFFHLAHTDSEPIATQQALIRNVFGLFARGGIYVVWTPIPEYQALFASLGFELLPDARSWFWGPDQASDAFVLDLTRVGVEPWIAAIVGGRPPPRTVVPMDMERALHSALPHWHDDSRLGASALAALFGTTSADQVRATVAGAMETRRAHTTPQVALSYRALQLAYLTRAASHERVAEELAVSRSTLYRLLRRAVSDLALTLAHATPVPGEL
jgi:hypothetical protein